MKVTFISIQALFNSLWNDKAAPLSQNFQSASSPISSLLLADLTSLGRGGGDRLPGASQAGMLVSGWAPEILARLLSLYINSRVVRVYLRPPYTDVLISLWRRPPLEWIFTHATCGEKWVKSLWSSLCPLASCFVLWFLSSRTFPVPCHHRLGQHLTQKALAFPTGHPGESWTLRKWKWLVLGLLDQVPRAVLDCGWGDSGWGLLMAPLHPKLP